MLLILLGIDLTIFCRSRTPFLRSTDLEPYNVYWTGQRADAPHLTRTTSYEIRVGSEPLVVDVLEAHPLRQNPDWPTLKPYKKSGDRENAEI